MGMKNLFLMPPPLADLYPTNPRILNCIVTITVNRIKERRSVKNVSVFMVIGIKLEL
jgi:hypothetical protein